MFTCEFFETIDHRCRQNQVVTALYEKHTTIMDCIKITLVVMLYGI